MVIIINLYYSYTHIYSFESVMKFDITSEQAALITIHEFKLIKFILQFSENVAVVSNPLPTMVDLL